MKYGILTLLFFITITAYCQTEEFPSKLKLGDTLIIEFHQKSCRTSDLYKNSIFLSNDTSITVQYLSHKPEYITFRKNRKYISTFFKSRKYLKEKKVELNTHYKYNTYSDSLIYQPRPEGITIWTSYRYSLDYLDTLHTSNYNEIIDFYNNILNENTLKYQQYDDIFAGDYTYIDIYMIIEYKLVKYINNKKVKGNIVFTLPSFIKKKDD